MHAGGKLEQPPCVSIGVPVRNGEAYLDRALASLLAQDFTDFEVLICDNASTDRTVAIADAWAAKDPRVKVFRNEVNIGAERNFSRVFTLARGRYFRWAAHDDLIDPQYLRRCVAALEGSPDAVLSNSWVNIIDDQDRVIGFYDGGVAGAYSTDIAERFAALVLSRHLCTDLFGLIRADALRKTKLLGPYYGADRALLAELGLLGRFVLVSAPLFSNREHAGRSSRSLGLWRTAGGLPSLVLLSDYRRAVSTHVSDRRTRLACRMILLRWWVSNWNFARVIAEMITRVHPPFEKVVQRLKLRFYGSMPQIQPRFATRSLSAEQRVRHKVALLIPHYNDRHGLLKSVGSVDESEAVDLFIVDDGSDHILPESEIRAAFKSAGKIYLIRLAENSGVAAALNAGLQEILRHGYEYVARLDAGDVCFPNRLQKQCAFLDANPAVALVGAWAEFVDEAGEHLFVLKHPSESAAIKRRMYLNNMFVHPSVMFRSSAVREIGPYPVDYDAVEDYAYFFEFTKRYATSNVPMVLIKYEVSSRAISTVKRRQQVQSRIRIILKHFYFGWYPICGLVRNSLLLLLPRSATTAAKKILWNR